MHKPYRPIDKDNIHHTVLFGLLNPNSKGRACLIKKFPISPVSRWNQLTNLNFLVNKYDI